MKSSTFLTVLVTTIRQLALMPTSRSLGGRGKKEFQTINL